VALLALAILLCGWHAGCGRHGDPAELTREVPGFPGRPYVLHLPNGKAPAEPTPLVLAIHGGGGSSDGAKRVPCPGGNLDDPGCLHKIGDARGFAVAFPNGVGGPLLPNVRTWNAGGGNGFECCCGTACDKGVDDVAYFRALLDDAAKVMTIDPRRVFATGMSNGGAMSHRLACELSDRIAAIAPVGGGNELATGAPCSPPRAVPVLDIHGTLDPCWPYAGGLLACIGTHVLPVVAIPKTVTDWAARDGCPATPVETDLPDSDPGDGTRAHLQTFGPCRDGAEVIHYRVEGAGHTWPRGYQYFATGIVGRMSQDFSANEVIWAFFEKHPKP
jgi:polyhydroxybutyrate depolymerase